MMAKRKQSGVALVVVLVFMLALTGLGLMSARLALGGETLARNQLDHEVAFQAAEAALRDAERDLLLAPGASPAGARCLRGKDRDSGPRTVDFTGDCLRGQCGRNLAREGAVDFSTGSTAREVWWPSDTGGLWNDDVKTKPAAPGQNCDFTGAVPLGTFTGTLPIQAVARQPEYLIEYVDRGSVILYRVTARGFGYREASEVVLQSYVLSTE